MKVLAIETSSAIGTIALAIGNRLDEREIPTPREQTELVLPLIDALLEGAGIELASLDAIVFGRGPGSFTGLRVAAAVAQGLAMAVGVPIVAVSSLAALAQRAWESERVGRCLICVDARMREVYSAVYAVRDGLATLERAERLSAPSAVAMPGTGDWCAIGDGFAVYTDLLRGHMQVAERTIADLAPRAADLITLGRHDAEAGRFVAPERALPVYLREESAWEA